MRFFKNSSLSLFFLALLLLSVVFQAIVGHDLYNDEEASHAELNGEEPQLVSFGRYLFTSHFGQALMENWQSEYLQFSLLILATVWFLQRGSTESKELGKEGTESDQQQMIGGHAQQNSPKWAKKDAGAVRLWIYSNSLLLVMGLIFFLSWFAQSVTGWSEFNANAAEHGEAPLSWLGYVGSSSFWFDTLQNWQSEFLAVGSMAVLSIYLRQRGSPESKPVGAPHTATGVEG
jgi:hypothetical protein